MPQIRAFRALRYADDASLARVVSPPYDVISPAAARALAARHPRNVVRLDLPAEEPGDEPDERYRRAAHTLAAWRSDGTLRKDPKPGVYVYEQAYTAPGSGEPRVQRGFFGRLRLEPLGPGSSILPHERTLAAPREDRYRLLRATGTNLSPIIGLYEDASGRSEELLASVAGGTPIADATDDDGVRHRLWIAALGEPGGVAEELLQLAGAGAMTIADGHHRYETALRYRDERRMTRSCEEDPAFDYVLALLLEATRQPLTVLPTHRVILGLGDDGVERLWAAVPDLFVASDAAGPADVVMAMRPGTAPVGRGRFGLVTRSRSAVLSARRGAFEAFLHAGSPALRGLDVTLLTVALERLAAIDPDSVAAGGRVAYETSADEAAAWVAAGTDGADAAFLLDPTPVSSIVAVAAAGDVMPQKSTYFYPKPLSGLVMNPHEW